MISGKLDSEMFTFVLDPGESKHLHKSLTSVNSLSHTHTRTVRIYYREIGTQCLFTFDTSKHIYDN